MPLVDLFLSGVIYIYMYVHGVIVLHDYILFSFFEASVCLHSQPPHSLNIRPLQSSSLENQLYTYVQLVYFHMRMYIWVILCTRICVYVCTLNRQLAQVEPAQR